MFRKTISLVLSAALVLSGVAAPASAAVIGTQEALAVDARQSQIADIQGKLSRDDVRQAMIAMGVQPEQAQLRVSSLSDAELARLQSELDSLPAGGSFLALVGAVFVVLLILELTGVINIFHKP
jgi:TolA-binding protein